MKNVIIGLFAIVGVVVGVLILGGLVGLFVYYWGWAVGWLVNLVVEIDIIFGITFEQLFGLMSVFSTMIASSMGIIANSKVDKTVSTKIKEAMKDYRGY